MHVLLLRLAAPVQSWGVASRFGGVRDSRVRPSKSGVVGLAAAALGRDRSDPVDDLALVRFGVRADRPGVMARDYSVSGSGDFPLGPRDLIRDSARAAKVEKVSGEGGPDGVFGHFVANSLRDWYGAPKEIAPDSSTGVLAAGNLVRDGVLGYRWNIHDAAFVAAFEHEDEGFLAEIGHALEHPARLLWLGRKASPPSGTICGGVYAGSLEDVMGDVALLPDASEVSPWAWFETAPHESGAVRVNDQPISFREDGRSYGPRWERQVQVIPRGGIEWEVIP